MNIWLGDNYTHIIRAIAAPESQLSKGFNVIYNFYKNPIRLCRFFSVLISHYVYFTLTHINYEKWMSSQNAVD